MKHRCKITVLHREYYPELAEQYVAVPTGPCELFCEGQEFVVEEDDYTTFPYKSGFCPWAWDCISLRVYAVLMGGRPFREGWSRDPNMVVICCNDGVRPVIFKLERVDIEE